MKRIGELSNAWTAQVGAPIGLTKYAAMQALQLFEYYGKLIQEYKFVDERTRDNGGYAVARRVRSGSVTVNGLVVDIKMPFGGHKQSGLGREGGIEGLDPYFELKTVHFA